MADEERDLSVKVYSYFCACVLTSKEGWFRVLQIYKGVGSLKVGDLQHVLAKCWMFCGGYRDQWASCWLVLWYSEPFFPGRLQEARCVCVGIHSLPQDVS